MNKTKDVRSYFSYEDRDAIMELPARSQEKLACLMESVTRLDMDGIRAEDVSSLSSLSLWVRIGNAASQSGKDKAWLATVNAVSRITEPLYRRIPEQELSKLIIEAAGLVILEDSEFAGRQAFTSTVASQLERFGISYAESESQGSPNVLRREPTGDDGLSDEEDEQGDVRLRMP